MEWFLWAQHVPHPSSCPPAWYLGILELWVAA